MADSKFNPNLWDNPFAIQKAEPKPSPMQGYGLDNDFFEGTKEAFAVSQDLLRGAGDASRSWFGRQFLAPGMVKAARNIAEGTAFIVQQAAAVGDTIREAGDKHAQSQALRAACYRDGVRAQMDAQIDIDTFEERRESQRQQFLLASQTHIHGGEMLQLDFGVKKHEAQQLCAPAATSVAIQDAISGNFRSPEAKVAGAIYWGEKLKGASDAQATQAAMRAEGRVVPKDDETYYFMTATHNRQAYFNTQATS
jgi:hypothetical protein